MVGGFYTPCSPQCLRPCFSKHVLNLNEYTILQMHVQIDHVKAMHAIAYKNICCFENVKFFNQQESFSLPFTPLSSRSPLSSFGLHVHARKIESRCMVTRAINEVHVICKGQVVVSFLPTKKTEQQLAATNPPIKMPRREVKLGKSVTSD